MTIDIIIIISFIGTVSLLAFSVGYILYVTKKDKEIDEKRQEIYNNAQQILNHAHTRAKQILEEAAEKAHEMLLDINHVHKNIEEDMDKTLDTIENQTSQELNKDSKLLLDEYKKSLEILKTQYLKELEEMLKQLEGTTEQEFYTFKQTLEKETKEAETTLSKEVAEEFKKTQQEIEAYKESQKKKVDETAKNIALKIAEELLGRSITIPEHEKLVVEALEKARKRTIIQLMENSNKSLSFQILEIIRTKEEATYFIEDLRKLSNSIFNAKINPEQALKENISFTRKEKLMALLKNNNVDLNNPSQTQDFLLGLEKTIEKIPVLNLKIAFEPKSETIDNISDWIILQLKKEIFLDISVDENVIGGAVITYNGIYKDFSLKKIIEKEYLTQ